MARPAITAAKCGIGMNITSEAPYTVQMLHEGRSAHRSGLIHAGDVIESISGAPCDKLSIPQVTGLILGDNMTEVELRLYRSGQLFSVWLYRTPAKLTPLQVNKQRELQRIRSEEEAIRARANAQISKLTEMSYMASEYSFSSVRDGDGMGRTLGSQWSIDPEREVGLHGVISVMSEVSFDPEKLGYMMSEKSFDPEALLGGGSSAIFSEMSFDPELLVGGVSEKSFDPEALSTMGSEKSFDPEGMGFMSEKSFDPEALAQASVQSINSQMSYDPETMPFARADSDESNDPEDAHALSRSTHPNNNTNKNRTVVVVDSQASFDPDNTNDARSERSYDPESEVAGVQTRMSVASINSQVSFDPDKIYCGVHGGSEDGGADSESIDVDDMSVHERDVFSSKSMSEKSFDPEQSSVYSAVSFDPQRDAAADRTDAKRHSYAASFASEGSFDVSEYGGVRVQGSRVWQPCSVNDVQSGGYSFEASSSDDEGLDVATLHNDMLPLCRALRAELSVIYPMPADDEEGRGCHGEARVGGIEMAGEAAGGGQKGGVEQVGGVAEGVHVSVDEQRQYLEGLLRELDDARALVASLQKNSRGAEVDAGLRESVMRVSHTLKDLRSYQAAIETVLKAENGSGSNKKPHRSRRDGSSPGKSENGRGSDRRQDRTRMEPVKAGLGFKYRRLKSGLFEITEVKERGAAAVSRAVRVGDRVAEVDGKSVKGIASHSLAEMLLGDQGTRCDIVLQRGAAGAQFRVLLERMAKKSQDEGFSLEVTKQLQAGSGRVASDRDENASECANVGSSEGQGRAVGLGFTYRHSRSKHAWVVCRVKAGGYAARSGVVEEGDVLVTVDGKPCSGMGSEEMSALLRGGGGSLCSLEVLRGGVHLTVEAVRGGDAE